MHDTGEILYSKTIQAHDHTEIRLTVHEFRGVEYLSIREYYLSFEEEWLPTKKGINIPLDLETSYLLFQGLADILSNAETDEVINEAISRLSSK